MGDVFGLVGLRRFAARVSWMSDKIADGNGYGYGFESMCHVMSFLRCVSRPDCARRHDRSPKLGIT